MTSFVLKIVAIISMLFDHLGYTIYGNFSFFNYIGRFAFPIFAFQLTEGFIHTKNLKKFFFRLGLFAIISQIPYYLFHNIITNNFSLNILFTLLLGLLAITIFDNLRNKYLGLLCVFLIAIIAELIKVDYGYFGILVIFLFYIFKENKLYMATSFILAVSLKYSINLIQNNFYFIYYVLALFTSLSIIPILLYNKKQGKNIKYLFYIFYPAHLILLYLIQIY